MSYESMKPYGAALLDYFNGNTDAVLLYERDDEFLQEEPVSIFFRKPSDFSQHEHTALNLCYGHILDIGAGAGVHSLVLQGRGFNVTAVDILPEAVEVMTRSGVKDFYCVDVYNFREKTFDTLLLLGRGIGMVGDLKGLKYFLADVKRLLNSGGQLLLNSSDVTCTAIPENLSYHELNIKSGRYVGEIGLRLHYKDITGKSFSWLHVDPNTLTKYAYETGWNSEIIEKEEDGAYLMRLSI